MRRAALAVIIALAAPAGAEPRPANLRLRAPPLPLPDKLEMRVAQRPAPPPPEKPADPPAEDQVSDVEVLALETELRDRIRDSDRLGQRRTLDERVVLQVSLGVGLDGGQPSGDPLLSGAPLDQDAGYADLRSYGFGDLILGTNGLGTRSLRSYFAASYRFDNPTDRASSPVPTVYDGDLENRVLHSGWIDLEQVFDQPLLRPLYLRVGRQFKYSPAMINFDGLSFGYKTEVIRAAGFFGRRASPYGFDGEDAEAQITGFEANADLWEWRRWPVVLSGGALFFDEHRHLDVAAAIRWRRNMLVRAKVRNLDGDFARGTVRLRGRTSSVTTFSVILDNQTENDWLYDLLALAPATEIGEARSYLNLGPPRPRVRLSGRAGTVLLRNVDVLGTAAVALEHGDEEEFERSAFRSTYAEGGAAVEIRLRRSVRIGTSGLARIYRRPIAETGNNLGVADPLPQTTESTGERGFVEGGGFARYSLGARNFSAAAELYGRALLPRSEYVRAPDEEWDLRSGGRFSIEGWATRQIRVALVYDLTFADLRYAPELRGIKQLRLTVEGTL